MTRDVDTLVRYLLVMVVIAAISSTAVPVLYSFGPWRTRKLGRLFMLQAISFSLALNMTVLFQFWHPKDILWVFWIECVVFTMIAVSTSALAWLGWRENHAKYKGKRRRSLMLFSESVYTKLKFLAQILLPALGTLYFTIAGIWSLPKAESVVGTIMAVDAFLGLLLGISSKTYTNSGMQFDGTMVVKNDPQEGLSMRVAKYDPLSLIEKDQLVFQVKQE